MPLAAEREYQHLGECRGCADHDSDLIHELARKLDALWHYDQYVANAEGHPHVQSLWLDLKNQCQTDIQRLKQLIGEEIRKGCF